VKSLSEQCKRHDVTFCFIETGKEFIKDDRCYHLPNKRMRSEMVYKANVNHIGRPMQFVLRDRFGRVIEPDRLYNPFIGQLHDLRQLADLQRMQ